MKKLSNKKLFIGGVILVVLPYLFWFFLGENSYVLIHDCLDHEFVFIKQLLNSGNLLGFDLNGKINGVMQGVPRMFYRSGFNFTFIIFSLFSPFTAYVIHHLIVHLVGFIGMYILLKRYFLQNKNLYALGISLCFGYLSYYHIQYGISISGQPILLYAFLNLLNNNNKLYNWIIIFTFPFFSFLPVTLPFFCPLLVIIGFYYYYQNKTFPIYFTLGIVLLCVVNVLVEFNLIYSIFFSGIESHRNEWDRVSLIGGLPTLKDFILSFYNSIKRTHYHSGILCAFPIIISVLLFYWQKKKSVALKFILAILMFNIIWYNLSYYIVYLLSDKISILKSFNIQRFYFFSPFLWLLALSITIDKMNFKYWLTKKIPIVLIITTAYGVVINNIELKNNLLKIINHPKVNLTPNFSQFYDKQLFETIKSDINLKDGDNYVKNQFICIGIFPNIVQYNGFNTLDSYQNNYPLAFKKDFREIISPELEKNFELKTYFDTWGSRCYAFSEELGRHYFFSKTDTQIINNLSYNWDKFDKMDGKYIISTVPIDTTNVVKLKFIRAYSTDESFWKIYLYELKNQTKIFNDMTKKL